MAACHWQSIDMTALHYLALGDSYTIGENVAEPERWPVQLAARLRADGVPLADPQIIAQTGWTTDELMVGIETAEPQGPFDLVSLLIGVNNQYRGRSQDEYRQQFATLLRQAIHLAGGDSQSVVVLSIPDWGVTPFAAGRNGRQIAAEIDAFNTINRTETQRLRARYVDITPTSRLAQTNPGLTAADGLHPASQMYAAWVELALPAAQAALDGHL
jgi:lysophospholipase L1-like esterase